MAAISDFSLATVDEIVKEIAQRAKTKRKSNIKRYGTQKEFAKHIGIPYRSYQEFEIKGKISFENLIKVLRGLDSIDEISTLLSPKDIDLFKDSKKLKQKFSEQKKRSKQDLTLDVDIPDVFGLN